VAGGGQRRRTTGSPGRGTGSGETCRGSTGGDETEGEGRVGGGEGGGGGGNRRRQENGQVRECDIYIVIKSREQVGPLGEIPVLEQLQTH